MKKNWWKERVVYQIYPRSFNDSNGDGIGDIPGIIEKLDILQDLGVGLIWLSPVYKSPNYDYGYDVSDYYNIHPEYGTMEDMDNLIIEAQKRDIKIVMDLVVNHTSNQHEWFQKSRKRIAPYTDYYIWKDGKNGGYPNNWTTFFAEDAWVYDDIREQYYLHLFAKEQPDLNYDNPLVIEEVKNILRFWLDKGIAGFRCDVINILHKSTLNDGKRQPALKGLEHYLSQEGTHDIIKELRNDVLDKYDCFTVGETILVDPKTARDLVAVDRKELDMLFIFEHTEADQLIVKWLKRKFNRKKFFTVLSKWQHALEWNANYFENHDQLRSVSRFGNTQKYWSESAKMLSLLLLTLRGTPFIYQGQEIGMTNFDITSIDDIKDIESHNMFRLMGKLFFPKWYRMYLIKISSRDNVRTPLQWSGEKGAGFTTGKPWLKINDNHKQINFEIQLDDPNSIFSFYKKVIEFRKQHDVLIYGDFKELLITRKLFVYERFLGTEKVIVLINMSTKNQKVDYKGKILLSNYQRDLFEGVLNPYEGTIIEPTK